MRVLLIVCLLLVGCGSSEDDPAGGGGGGGKGGESAGRGGSGGMDESDSGRGGAGGGGSGGRAGSGGSGGGDARRGMIRLVPNIVAGSRTGSDSSGIGSSQSALRVGSPSAATLLSLKYYVTSIQLCQQVELSGSGFSSTQGCIDLYRNQTPESPDYAEYTVSEAQADTTAGRYIDLMSSEGQAALRRPVNVEVAVPGADAFDDPSADDDSDAGVVEDDAPPEAYRFGLINFYRPIKVTAEFPIIGEPGQYFRTKAVTRIQEMPGVGGGLGTERVEIGDTLAGPTEETVYSLSNGGALFTFQKPFVITQADIDAEAEIKVDLVFNPDHFGQAYETDCSADVRAVICDPANGVALEMPFVRMNPVPRKAGERTRKEVYLLDYETYSQLRIELYYNDADPEAGIQGVDVALVYKSNANEADVTSFNIIASNFVSQVGSVRTDNASVALMDYRREVNLKGLRRRQAGTATVRCLFTGSLCPSLGVEIDRAYTYEGDVVVSSD
jgi:hypothetical protein